SSTPASLTASMSSLYLRTTPRVRSISSGVSDPESRRRSDSAQSSVSATPGGLNRFIERRRAMAEANEPASASSMPGTLRRTMAGDGQDWRVVGGDRADLGDGHLEIGQQLEEEGLELLIGPIQLVDQEHGASPIATRLDRLQEWACDEKVPAHDVLGADVAA